MSRYVKAEIEDLTSHAVNITFLLDFWEKMGIPKPVELTTELTRVVDLLKEELTNEARKLVDEKLRAENSANGESGGSVLGSTDRPSSVSSDRETVRRPRA